MLGRLPSVVSIQNGKGKRNPSNISCTVNGDIRRDRSLMPQKVLVYRSPELDQLPQQNVIKTIKLEKIKIGREINRNKIVNKPYNR